MSTESPTNDVPMRPSSHICFPVLQKVLHTGLQPQIILQNRYVCNGVQVSDVVSLEQIYPHCCQNHSNDAFHGFGLGKTSLCIRKTMLYMGNHNS